MAAHENVSKKQFYHVASMNDRESIAENGLDHARGQSPHSGIDYAQGNYVFTRPSAAHAYREIMDEHDLDDGGEFIPRDVWSVKGNPAEFKADQFADDESGLGKHSRFTTNPVPSKSMKLISRGDGPK